MNLRERYYSGRTHRKSHVPLRGKIFTNFGRHGGESLFTLIFRMKIVFGNGNAKNFRLGIKSRRNSQENMKNNVRLERGAPRHWTSRGLFRKMRSGNSVYRAHARRSARWSAQLRHSNISGIHVVPRGRPRGNRGTRCENLIDKPPPAPPISRELR